MSMTDPIADMLVRIKNAAAVGKPTVKMPSSNIKVAIDVLRATPHTLGPAEEKVVARMSVLGEAGSTVQSVLRFPRDLCRRRAETVLPLLERATDIGTVSAAPGRFEENPPHVRVSRLRNRTLSTVVTA